MNDDQEQSVLAVHVRGVDGMCAGCRAWWSRLAPYPCWQVEWATSRQARAITVRFQGPTVTTHGPVTPIWTCGGCDAPWPCLTRRRELRAEFADAPVSLALYLGSHLIPAAKDLQWIPAGELHRRFLESTAKMRRIPEPLRTPAHGRAVICVDEFGPLNLQPRPGRAWRSQGQPARLRVTYTRDQGVWHMIAALDLAPGDCTTASVTASAGASF